MLLQTKAILTTAGQYRAQLPNLYHDLLAHERYHHMGNHRKTRLFGNRPQKLYWKRKRLYYIFEDTGEIFWNKELHMQLIK